MSFERCPNCQLRVRGSMVEHEFSGRCLARDGAVGPVVATPAPSIAVWDVANDRLVVAKPPRKKREPGYTINAEPPPHGTRSRYTSRKHRCRCALCRRAATEYVKNLRRSPEGAARYKTYQANWRARKEVAQ